ncbi:hypothetical protein BH23ACT6_BH23ACT6_04470 [soil metagenome]
MPSLAHVARRSDAAVARARGVLVAAVRQAAASGMSQRDIADQIGRSQPEISRLLRFHGTSPLARRLRAARAQVLALVGETGGTNVCVFGSVATGTDGPDCDVDLLFTMGHPLSLMELYDLEERVSSAVGAKVDLVPDTALHPALGERVLAEQVTL